MAASILLDANILLELFFQRGSFKAVVKALSEEVDDKTRAVSIFSVAFFMYHVEKEKRSLQDAYDFLDEFVVVDMSKADYDWAQSNDQGDFEDALQVGCALRHGCRRLITLDKQLASRHNKHLNVYLIK